MFSHGFVRYKIKPKYTLILNNTIDNNAAIYFDFNAPVITNTAVTTVVLPVGIAEPAAGSTGLRIYPNPASEKVFITGAEIEIRITDLFGRVIHQSAIKNPTEGITLDVQHLSRGVYVAESNGMKIKFVKQ